MRCLTHFVLSQSEYPTSTDIATIASHASGKTAAAAAPAPQSKKVLLRLHFHSTLTALTPPPLPLPPHYQAVAKSTNVDPEVALGASLPDSSRTITRNDVISYALAVGAAQEKPTCPSELRYTYENAEGFSMLPTMVRYAHAYNTSPATDTYQNTEGLFMLPTVVRYPHALHSCSSPFVSISLSLSISLPLSLSGHASPSQGARALHDCVFCVLYYVLRNEYCDCVALHSNNNNNKPLSDCSAFRSFRLSCAWLQSI